MKRTNKEVGMNEIRIDGGTQSRVSIDPHWIAEIVENIKNDVVYPPVKARFDGVDYWLTDGFHRYHAYIQLGLKRIEVAYLPGSVADARKDSYGANSDHGKPRTREDKIKAVESALADPDIENKTDYEIAKICNVSRPFVGAIRDPKIKEKQAENYQKHVLKKSNTIRENTEEKDEKRNSITLSDEVVAEKPQEGDVPDDAELLANQKKHEADLDRLANFLDADDKMKHLYEENQRLASQVVMKDLRIKELMNEKREAIKMVKDLQKQLDKLKAKK
jgi:ParB-like chromosome segregation protein Spo0J